MEVLQTMHRQASFWIAPSRIAISWKDDKTSSSIFLKLLSISLVKFSYWSKFLVNIITGVMAIFIYKELKSQIIGNIPIWVLPNNWRLKQVRNTKFGTNVSKKMLLNAAKCQGYTFYHLWVIKEKPTVESKITLTPFPD